MVMKRYNGHLKNAEMLAEARKESLNEVVEIN